MKFDKMPEVVCAVRNQLGWIATVMVDGRPGTGEARDFLRAIEFAISDATKPQALAGGLREASSR